MSKGLFTINLDYSERTALAISLANRAADCVVNARQWDDHTDMRHYWLKQAKDALVTLYKLQPACGLHSATGQVKIAMKFAGKEIKKNKMNLLQRLVSYV